jgi:holliday junction DNA helicase RuvA
MIAFLRGTLTEKSATEAIVETHGVGYRVFLSAQSLIRLPAVGDQTSLRIRTVVREDAFDLYGFLSQSEEELFLLLNSVSGVGPKLALSVLSGLEADALLDALAKGEVARLTKIHGVGKKTAERLVLELKDKAKQRASPVADSRFSKSPSQPSASGDLVSAMLNLGYKEAQAEKAVSQALSAHGETAAFDVLFREAMKAIRSN